MHGQRERRLSTDSLAGRRALVTGGSSGIGRAIAGALRAAGASVAIVARRAAPLEDAARATGAHAVAGDVTDAWRLPGVLERCRSVLGGAPDVLVNAAGAFALEMVHTTAIEEFDRMLAVNLRAPFLLIRSVLPAMLERRAGDIVSIGSVAGRQVFPRNGAYSASKFGLRGLHAVLQAELKGTGVRATLVEPAATDTGLWDPVDPDADPELPHRSAMMRPDDVAEAVLFALTRRPAVGVSNLLLERA